MKRGRPIGTKKPAYAAVEELARLLLPQCGSPREAVRRAADIYIDLGDVLFGEGHPAPGILPTEAQDAAASRVLAADMPRQKARMAKWSARLKGRNIGPDEPPPWPQTTLDSKDTVVDQIARRLPKRNSLAG